MATLRQRVTTSGDERSNGQPAVDVAAEELPTLLDPATCTRKGMCPVMRLRGEDETNPLESHSLYFEIHGSGPERIVLIIGLNGSFVSWVHQVEYLSRVGRYTVLVFDNRGVGNSDTPRGPYSTSAMAEDAIALLDFVNWTDSRCVNIVGISLGGMIAQEIASRIPERIASLLLAVTTPGGPIWSNFPPWLGVKSLTRLLFITDRAKKVPIAVNMLFAQSWLNAVAKDDSEGRTNRAVEEERFLWRMSAIRVQQPLGALSQMWAGMTHHVSNERLHDIAARVPLVVLLTGDEDHLVDPSNTRRLAAAMPNAELITWENTGHAVHLQHVERFNAVIERMVAEGRRRVDVGEDLKP